MQYIIDVNARVCACIIFIIECSVDFRKYFYYSLKNEKSMVIIQYTQA